MRIKTGITVGSLLMVFSSPVWAMDVSQFLNKANQINYEESQSAKLAQSKVGDNQALMTFADTMRGDHQANEQAVGALSRQNNIKLHGFNPPQNQMDELKNLNGGAFNQAFLRQEIQGHRNAIDLYRQAQSDFRNYPDVELYIDQSLPVLRAHLQMAERLDQSMKTAMSHENPSNNRSMNNGRGDSAHQFSRNYSEQ